VRGKGGQKCIAWWGKAEGRSLKLALSIPLGDLVHLGHVLDAYAPFVDKN